MLTRSPRAGYNHTRDIYRCYVQDRIVEFARFDESQTQRRVNAFIMSGLFFPPNARFVLLCHIMTPPHSARRRPPYPYVMKELV